MAKIRIDGREYEVDAAKNLLEVSLSLGLDLPYFCWHPALGSVGACRQCAVKQYRGDDDTEGQIVMACMTPASDGCRFSIDDPGARELRASVIEWLMVNHPHDCPICDEGGECHLQDMTVKTGHNYRDFRFKKSTYVNQDLGPFINHEMNRCIQCYRCVRFYGDHAGGGDLRAMGSSDHIYFGRKEDGVLESEFSGNLVEICPTGVFTDKRLKKHYNRKWDLRTAPSVCVHCSLGCNLTPGERYGELRRVRARYHGEVNGYFLCDRGRYGYEFVSGEKRVREPLLPQGPEKEAKPADGDEIRRRLEEALAKPERVVGIGSPRASLEGNFALRTLVGEERFYQGVGAAEADLVATVLSVQRQVGVRTPSLRQVEECDAALVLGEDVTQTAPILALALRQTVKRQPRRAADKLHIPAWHEAAVQELVQDEKGPLYIASPGATRLDDVARAVARAVPDDVARLGYAVAHELDASAPAVPDLGDDERKLAAEIAGELAAAERPVVVSGTSCGSAAVLKAAANVARALGKKRGAPADLVYALAECNSAGAGLLGGEPLESAFATVDEGRADTVVILENDLYRRADRAAVDRFLAAARHVVVIDHLAHPTAAGAGLVLPAATFVEAGGTLVSNEGRAQRFHRVVEPVGEIRAGWRWLTAARAAAGGEDGWQKLDDVVAALAADVPAFARLPEVAPAADVRQVGKKAPRALHRYSGRTAMRAHLSMHEPKPADDPDSPFTSTMEGYDGTPPAALAAEFWAPGWNSIQSLTRFQEEVAGPLRGGDPGVRLLAAAEVEGEAEFFTEVPAAFDRRDGEWLVVALHHIFGSEELSVEAPGIAELMPQPYVALHPDDAAALGAAEGGQVGLDLGGAKFILPVAARPELTPGMAGLPAGLPGLGPVPAGRWIRLMEVSER